MQSSFTFSLKQTADFPENLFREAPLAHKTFFSSGILLSIGLHCILALTMTVGWAKNTIDVVPESVPVMIDIQLSAPSTPSAYIQHESIPEPPATRPQQTVITSDEGIWSLQSNATDESTPEAAVETVATQDTIEAVQTETQNRAPKETDTLPLMSAPNPIEALAKIDSATNNDVLDETLIADAPVTSEMIEHELPKLNEEIEKETQTLRTPAPSAATKSTAVADAEPAISPMELQRLNLQNTVGRKAIYPALALKRGSQGDVTLLLLFDSDGHFENATVAQTSGDKLLDKAALKTAKKALKRETDPALAGQSLSIVISYRLQ